MSNNWITSVYNLCIITAFIEHTHVKTEDICKVYGTVCSASSGLIASYGHCRSEDLYKYEAVLDN